MKAKEQAQACAHAVASVDLWARKHMHPRPAEGPATVVGAYINNQLAAIRLVLGELPKQTPAHREAIKDALDCISNAKAITDILTGQVRK